ncbi:MAG: response regulator [Caldilineaceae bacterium]
MSQTAAPIPLNYQDYHILIVDDTPVNLAVLVEYLEAYGFGIRIARTGESALQRAQYDAPDIILLDVLLPGLDGFATCRQLKATPSTCEIPVIFMTSLTGAEDKVRGFEAGAVDYVTKPLQQAEVLARIETHLRLRHLAQNLQEQNRQLSTSSRVERERLLEAVSQQRTQLRTLARKLTEVQEEERKRLARELHDEMGQALTALRMNLTAIEKETPSGTSARTVERIREAAWLADQTLEQIRELSQDLRPPMLDDLGLLATVRWYVKRFGQRMNVQTQLDATGLQTRLASPIETALYRVLQEALTNVARHAEATHVLIQLQTTKESVALRVVDDGCGFDVGQSLAQSELGGGMGLLSMRERVTLLGGSFVVEAQPGAGAKVCVEIPLEQGHG